MGLLSDILGKSWEGAKWFFDSSPLKPISDAIRQNPEVARVSVPGFKQAEQLFGTISGAGALAGMGMNLDPRNPEKFKELPENWREILKPEVEAAKKGKAC